MKDLHHYFKILWFTPKHVIRCKFFCVWYSTISPNSVALPDQLHKLFIFQTWSAFLTDLCNNFKFWKMNFIEKNINATGNDSIIDWTRHWSSFFHNNFPTSEENKYPISSIHKAWRPRVQYHLSFCTGYYIMKKLINSQNKNDRNNLLFRIITCMWSAFFICFYLFFWPLDRCALCTMHKMYVMSRSATAQVWHFSKANLISEMKGVAIIRYYKALIF